MIGMLFTNEDLFGTQPEQLDIRDAICDTEGARYATEAGLFDLFGAGQYALEV